VKVPAGFSIMRALLEVACVQRQGAPCSPGHVGALENRRFSIFKRRPNRAQSQQARTATADPKPALQVRNVPDQRQVFRSRDDGRIV
jgi:hypothetical protein